MSSAVAPGRLRAGAVPQVHTVTRPIKLGVTLLGLGPVPQLVAEAREAEAVGFDVVLLPDHLSMTAPLVPLVAIAEAAPTVQVSNNVLNAAFHRPALLARDLASVDSATGGRLIISLGAGHMRGEEFVAAGMPFPTAGERVKLLTEHVTEIRRLLSDPGHIPPPVQTPPPIMVTAGGDKMLTLAAQKADIVGVASGRLSDADLAERVAFVNDKAGDRIDDIELSFTFAQVSMDDPSDLSILQMIAPDASEEEVRKFATVLDVPAQAATERVQRFHEEMGISYFILAKTPATSWDTFEKLIADLR